MESFFVVATPIGNLDDITIRAINTLKEVDFIVCEDTRVTTKLLNKLSIKKTLYQYNDHSGEKERSKLITIIKQGKVGALVSDAGTPLISDPGYKLLQTIRNLDIKIVSIPGPSSIITALSYGYMPTDQFFFAGYLPPKKIMRRNFLSRLSNIEATLIFLQTAPKIIATLNDIHSILGNPMVTIARELTKIHETLYYDTVKNLITNSDHIMLKGEFILLVSGVNKNDFNQQEVEQKLKHLMKTKTTKDAVNLVCRDLRLSRTQVYNIARKIIL